jgi:hypothetical protein
MMILAGLGGVAALAQGGEFVNLGFDEPDLTHVQYELVRDTMVAPVTEALRGWSVTPYVEPLPYGGTISVNGGGPPFGLVPVVDQPGKELYGNYYLSMDSYWTIGGQSPARHTVIISQTGLVPAGAGLLVFQQDGGWGTGPIGLEVNGQSKTQFPYWGWPFTFSAIDVSGSAGRDVSLSVVFPEGGAYTFDIRGFEAVPEPSTFVLVVVGGAALLLARWKLTTRSEGG